MLKNHKKPTKIVNKHSLSSKKPSTIKSPRVHQIPLRKNQTLLRHKVAKNNHFDAVVIGAGIGGIAAALGIVTPSLSNPPLSNHNNSSLINPSPRRVLVIEKEKDFCFHSTGRSASIFSEIYGSPTIQALSSATKPFLYTPTSTGLLSLQDGGSDNDLVFKRGTLWVATKKSQQDLIDLYTSAKSLVPSLRMVTLDEMYTMVPATKYPASNDKIDYDDDLAAIYGEDDGDYVPTMAFHEPDAADMDVNAIWQAMSKLAIQNGAELISNVSLSQAQYSPTTKWSLQLNNKIQHENGNIEHDVIDITTNLLVNAAGAWANEVNQIVGTIDRSIQPKQRTIIQFLPTEYKSMNNNNNHDEIKSFDQWPSVFDMHDRFYYKPDGGRVLASPCDEQNVEPGDVQPDEMSIALNVERIRSASFFDPQHILHKWAGLRSFAPDREFVLGFDGGNPGSKHYNTKPQQTFGQDLIHVAGLGGYGIQSCLANASCVSGLVHNGQFPKHIIDMGLDPSAICPARF